MTTAKITYLDGVRGLAALMVLLHHICVGFIPTLYTADERTRHAAWESWLVTMPFNPVSLGNTFVCIFFMLSGYVLTHSLLSRDRQAYPLAALLQRYVRLTLPIAVTILLTVWVLRSGYMVHLAAAQLSQSYWWLGNLFLLEADFSAAAREALWQVYWLDPQFNPVLWTMRIEWWGSVLLFAVVWLARRPNLRLLACCGLAVLLWDVYYSAFLLGIVGYDLCHHQPRRIGWPAAGGLLLAGTYLGSFPHAAVTGSIYQPLAAFWQTADEFMRLLGAHFQISSALTASHFCGAVCWMAAVMLRPELRRPFDGVVLQTLGRWAYALYLLHLLWIVSLLSWVYLLLRAHLDHYPALLLALLLTLPVLLLAVALFQRWVDAPATRLGAWIGARLRGWQDQALGRAPPAAERP